MLLLSQGPAPPVTHDNVDRSFFPRFLLCLSVPNSGAPGCCVDAGMNIWWSFRGNKGAYWACWWKMSVLGDGDKRGSCFLKALWVWMHFLHLVHVHRGDFLQPAGRLLAEKLSSYHPKFCFGEGLKPKDQSTFSVILLAVEFEVFYSVEASDFFFFLTFRQFYFFSWDGREKFFFWQSFWEHTDFSFSFWLYKV